MRILLLAAFLSVGSAIAAPFAVQVGEAKIGLDAPPGFADTGFTGSPRLLELAETLTSASNRILLFAISDADLRRFMVGDTPEFRRYMLAVTPKGLERDRVSAGAFAGFVAESLRELGVPAAHSDYPKYLDSQPQGKASLLAGLRKDPDVVSVLQGSRLPSPGGRFQQEKPQYLLSTTTLMLVRGKALSLAVYTGYNSPADLDWIRSITARWIEELRRLNSR
jgi:hypothetical protein